jgi:uncharacterized protein (DUF1501 family)
MLRRSLHHITRRQLLGAGIAGTLGWALSPQVQHVLANTGPARRARACVLVWLNGGPSHIDTFDPKPGADTGGPFRAIATAVPGLRLSEHFPRLAKQAGQVAVVRSMTSREADHDRAVQYLHTGSLPSETVEYPELGSVVARTWSSDEDGLPAFVAIDGTPSGAGFLGQDFAAYSVSSDPKEAGIPNVALPEGVDEARLRRRLRAMEELNRGFGRRADPAAVAAHAGSIARGLRFRSSPGLKAFNLSAEKPATRAAYGIKDKSEGTSIGRACLLARRLVESGVRFVEVSLDGWDTHTDNFNTVKQLSQQLDPALAALLAELQGRGRLAETLVICMGEFGRTPQINSDNGRDHHSEAFSLLLAGGGIRGGAVVGATDAQGVHVKDRPLAVPDLYATLLHALGIDGRRVYRVGGRPVRLVDKGKVATELF